MQIDSHIKIRSSSNPKKQYRKARNLKINFIDKQIDLLKSKTISQFEFVTILSYRFHPV